MLRSNIRATLNEFLTETEPDLTRKQRRQRARTATKIAYRAMKDLGPTPRLADEALRVDLQGKTKP
jgi:hypothetical protein